MRVVSAVLLMSIGLVLGGCHGDAPAPTDDAFFKGLGKMSEAAKNSPAPTKGGARRTDKAGDGVPGTVIIPPKGKAQTQAAGSVSEGSAGPG
jgi:hypothetical protein